MFPEASASEFPPDRPFEQEPEPEPSKPAGTDDKQAEGEELDETNDR